MKEEKKLLSQNAKYNLVIFLVIALCLVAFLFIKTYTGYVVLTSKAGTITELIIEQRDPARIWQGFYGLGLMVQGYDELQYNDAEPGKINSMHLIFNCLEPNIEHEIYASPVDPNLMDFSNVVPADLEWIDDYFNISHSSQESATKTFTSTGSLLFGTTTITNIPITRTKKYNSNEISPFILGVLNAEGVPLFFTNITDIQRGFSNQMLNYQLLLPAPNTTLYYFFPDPNDVCPEGLGIGTTGSALLSGYAYSNATGLPLENVTVAIAGVSNETDSNGYYELIVRNGNHYLVGIKTGYYTHVAQINITISRNHSYNFSMNVLTTVNPGKSQFGNGSIIGFVKDNSTNLTLGDVEISINGKINTTSDDGFYNMTVVEGTHIITAIKDSYDNFIGNAAIQINQTTTFNISLQPTKGFVKGKVFDSNHVPIADAQIIVSDKNTTTNITGDYNISATRGETFLIAYKEGYENYITNITIIAGRIIFLNITLNTSVTLIEGTFLNNGTVSGIVRDNSTNQQLPNVSINVAGTTELTDPGGFYNITSFEGNHNLVAVKEGYENYITQINITKNQTLYNNISLVPYTVPAGPNGTVTGFVKTLQGSVISNVIVSIAGQINISNSTGGYYLRAPSGTHNIVATRTGYQPYYAEVNITSGATTYHNITLNASITPQTQVPNNFKGPGQVDEVPDTTEGIYMAPPKEQIDYEITVKKILQKVRVGSFINVPISIFNYRSEPMNIDLSVEGAVSPLIILDKSSISMNSNSEGEFTITIVGDAEVGLYEGDIVLSGSINEKIPISVLVYSKEKLPIEGLVVKLDLLDKKTSPGGKIKYNVDIQNLIKEEEYSIVLVHKIQSDDGNDQRILDRNNLRIKTSFSVLKNLEIPKDIVPGRYILTVEAQYLSLKSSQSSTFDVVKPFYSYIFFGIPVWAILIVVALISTSTFSTVVYKKKKSEKQRYKTSVVSRSLPQDGERSAFIGTIAEEATKTFFELEKLQTHAIIAGSSGSGKSVIAQIIAEEALKKKVSILVFDPTAQWTGFLRKNEDKPLLDMYPNFGMKKKDARSFNGNIHVVHDKRERINFKKIMNPGDLNIFLTMNLNTKDIETLVSNTIKEIFHSNMPESQELKYLLIYDGMHNLLPKFGGSGKVFVPLERATREFRKWGVGVILISQVLNDFPKEILANINTEIQLRSRDEGDLERIKDRYGEDILKSIVKSARGTAMVENSAYNKGQPYFIAFRPPLHSLKRLSEEDIQNYEKYNEIVSDIEYQLEQLKSENLDVFDLQLELKLVKDKVSSGSFNMVTIYLDSLTPRLSKLWEQIGKTPNKKGLDLMPEDSETDDASNNQEKAKNVDAVENAFEEVKQEDDINEINVLIEQAKRCLESKDHDGALRLYNAVTIKYKNLHSKNKQEIFVKCKELMEKLNQYR